MPDANNPLPAAVLAALQRSATVEAVKLLREDAGLSLAAATALIERHRSGRLAASARTAPDARDIPPAVIEAMRAGRKLEAIRLLREHNGLGLADAKAAVEALPRGADGATGRRSPAAVKQAPSLLWPAAVVLLAGYLLYRWFGGGN